MIPTYDVDLYTDAARAEPYEHYRNLRDLGPVVRLTAHDVHVVARDAEVRAVLEDPDTFCSGQGVGLNEFINEGGRGTTLMSDGEQHRRLRDVIGRPLTPKALAELRPDADGARHRARGPTRRRAAASTRYPTSPRCSRPRGCRTCWAGRPTAVTACWTGPPRPSTVSGR